MKKSKFVILSDAIFCFLLTSCILLIFFASIKIKYLFKLILAFLFALCLTLLLTSIKIKKYKLKLKSIADLNLINNLALKLEIMPDNDVIALLFKILQGLNINVTSAKNYLFSQNTFYLYSFNKQTTREELCAFIKQFSGKKIVLFCNQLTSEATNLCELLNFEIKIVNKELLYEKIKLYCPEFLNTLEKNATKNTFLKNFANKFLTKKRAFSYALIALFLLIFSYFTFFALYYRICALILTCFCIASIVANKQNNQNKNLKDFGN